MQQEAMVVQLTPAMCPPFAENEKNEEKKKRKLRKKKHKKGCNENLDPLYTGIYAP